MEKIVLVCKEPGNHGYTVALLAKIFPECTVEIVTESEREKGGFDNPLESMGSSFQLRPFREAAELES